MCLRMLSQHDGLQYFTITQHYAHTSSVNFEDEMFHRMTMDAMARSDRHVHSSRRYRVRSLLLRVAA